jgi:hypothetical protein
MALQWQQLQQLLPLPPLPLLLPLALARLLPLQQRP